MCGVLHALTPVYKNVKLWSSTVPHTTMSTPSTSSNLPANTMEERDAIYPRYPLISFPPLSRSGLDCKIVSEERNSQRLREWHEAFHRPNLFPNWLKKVRERTTSGDAVESQKQILLWTKGSYTFRNVFARTVDTGRLLPLDRTWTTHIYYHNTLPAMVTLFLYFSMVRFSFATSNLTLISLLTVSRGRVSPRNA